MKKIIGILLLLVFVFVVTAILSDAFLTLTTWRTS